MERSVYILIFIQLVFIRNILLYAITANTTDEFFLLGNEQSPCLRPCEANSTPLVCRYKFVLEWYQTMSRACYDCPRNQTDCRRPHCIPADGVSRPVLVINRQMPGPTIQVCQGDEIIVDVENRLQSEETTIHWHGHHQRKTPYMDGVPYVTQCPIPSGNSFRYHFVAEHAGTHFWHSHSGLQRGEGAFGSMIVRIPKEQDPHKDLYDFDLPSHVIIVLDWIHETGLSKFMHHHHSDGDNKPDSLLVNGLGYFKLTNETDYIPAARFAVVKGFRYRFRVINAEFLNCPIEISIDNHTLTVISSDGNNFEPVEVESFVTYAGERFDFIVNANQEIDNYWMRFRGLMDCDERFTSAHQVAVLNYVGARLDAYPDGDPDYNTSHKQGLQLNALNEGTINNNSLNIVELNATIPNDISLKEKPDYKFYISYDFYNITNPHFYAQGLYEYYAAHSKFKLTTPQLNHISMKMQPFPLLPGRNLLTNDMFCNETTVKNCTTDFCQCSHVLQVRYNSVVELILIDKGVMFDANHPFHLHGNSFRVVAMERIASSVTVDEIKALDNAGLISRKLNKAPLKDTVTVPDGGYTILRFHANNPGYWLFHCHIDFHAEIGMSLVFKVGENADMPPVPKNFPTCGNWLPDESEAQTDDGNKYSSSTTTTVSEITETTCNKTSTGESFIEQVTNLFYSKEDCANSTSSKQPDAVKTTFMCIFIVLISNSNKIF